MMVEFTAGMQFGHDNFNGRYFFFFVNTNRYSPAVVEHADTIVIVNGDVDLVAIAGHGLVNTVVHDFVNQVMQTGDIHVSNIHCRPFADRFQAFQYFNIIFGIITCFKIFFHIRIGIITLK